MTLYFAHATSFCAAVWDPVLEGLEGFDCVRWDFAGHGGRPELEVPLSWESFGEQVLDETEPGGIGIGHSMGGCAMAMAQLADPSRFTFLVLIEPVLFPGPHLRQDHPLSTLAERRKRTFSSVESARSNMSSKAAFGAWDPRAMDGYLRCGVREEPDGSVSLACDPEFEAEIYRSSNDHDTWERLGEIDVPVLILAGENSDTTPPDVARLQASQFRRAGIEIVPEAGHFLPMEKPDMIAERVRRIAGALSV